MSKEDQIALDSEVAEGVSNPPKAQQTPQQPDWLDELVDQTAINLKTSPDEMFDKGVKANLKQEVRSHIAAAPRR